MQVLNKTLPLSPHLLFFFLSEGSMLRDDDRMIDITGLLSSYHSTGVADQMPAIKITLTAVVGIHCHDRDASYVLKITGNERGKSEQNLWTVKMGVTQEGLINGECISMARQ